MAMYSYRCECGAESEAMIKMSEVDAHVEVCSGCGKEMKRLMNAVPFNFSGEPPRDWKPLSRSNPDSRVASAKELRKN